MSVQFRNPFKTTLVDKLRKYFLFGAKENLKAKQEANSKKNIQEIEAYTKIKVAAEKVGQYLKLISQAWSNEVASYYIEAWQSENTKRKDKDLKKDTELMEYQIHLVWMSCDAKINAFLNSIDKDIDEYLENRKIVKSDDKETKESVIKTIKTLGNNKFDFLKKQAQDIAKKLQAARIQTAKLRKVKLNAKIDTDFIFKELAKIPLTIEEEIQKIKDILDMILGKFLFPEINPGHKNFDIDVLIAKIKLLVEPVIAAIGPLESVAGKVPIIGDLISIMQLCSEGNKGKKLTKEDIKKLIGDIKPDLPGEIMEKVTGIKDDILALCAELPMILIDVIFQMIDAIIGMFNQICGIIGVPEIPFPLSLVPDAIAALPKIKKLIKQLPSLFEAMIKGLLKDKLAEALAMSTPLPNINYDMLESLMPEVDDTDAEKPSAKSKPEEKKMDFNDVIKKWLPLAESYGCDRTDLTRILKGFTDIHDGTNRTIHKYTDVTEVKDDKGEITNLISKPQDVKMTPPTPEEFNSVLSKTFSNVLKSEMDGKMVNNIKYDKVMKTASVVGALYNRYQNAIKDKEPYSSIVIQDTLDVKPPKS